MSARSLILVSNPGSQSRKYALYLGEVCLARLHFELVGKQIYCSLVAHNQPQVSQKADIAHIAFAATKVIDILKSKKIIQDDDQISAIGLRIVAPSSFFQTHRVIDKQAIEHLKSIGSRAVIHINSTLQEIELLKISLPKCPIIGVSDSAFTATEESYIRSYAIPQTDAKKFDVWRFGYHGLSVNSVVDVLTKKHRLADKVIVCHLGGGASITALRKGLVADNSMGYSPLEGLMMATRSGNIDPVAVETLKHGLGLTADKMQEYLSLRSGLLGVSGISDDIRELLAAEAEHPTAKLALDMYVSRIQQTIGQMVAVIGGIDCLVFTGTVGERSAIIRQRILSKMNYLHLSVDKEKNSQAIQPQAITSISPVYATRKVLVVPCDESTQIAKEVARFKY